ncbi:MAG TPA: ABC transporter ATP-binding protein [Aggregatilinea sp.]|uniref:ABC transporter ATP-binding protein n=1 Tax=Aggregatilinea sp. TaxID=2806333 RepID=UPI002BB856AB|nr:ABC transporter ATP-binding protein [Aggregatilinea sp.]HML23330.1 ABC transporter ATP-binding protein [Aggregatilinea sp.]
MTAVYEVSNVTKIYPGQTVPANDAISLAVEPGEIFGLLGDNGAGKSTLVRQMANLLAPTRGTIRLFGQPLGLAPLYVPGMVGYMPQNGMALNNLTVGETLYFTAHLRGLSRRDAKAERERLLDLLDLGPARDRLVPRISGGQRRLALLATTIAASPPVLVLDEPTNDLDPVHRRHVWDVVHDLNHARGTTIILVTHNVIEAERVIQRVGFMRAGRLVAVGRPGALKASLNEHLRLELTFPPGTDPTLPPTVEAREIGPGHWLLVMERAAALAYVAQIETERQVEDFRLSTATLEDLYLALVHNAAPVPEVA